MCYPHKDKYLGEKSKYKAIRRHVLENHKDDNKNFLETEKWKSIYDIKKETVERSFGENREFCVIIILFVLILLEILISSNIFLYLRNTNNVSYYLFSISKKSNSMHKIYKKYKLLS